MIFCVFTRGSAECARDEARRGDLGPTQREVRGVKAILNPYTPNAGAQPQALVGRDDQLESFDLLLARIERGR